MWNPPPDAHIVASGTPYVTKLRAKIIQTMDYILMCEDSEKAINGWELLCTHGYGLVRMAINDGKLNSLTNPETWKKLADQLINEWPPKTFEKTTIVPCADGRYKGSYDHYSVTVDREHIEHAQRSLEKESQNVIRSRLMKYWGECYAILLAVNYLNLEDEIAVPVQMDDRYTKDKMRQGSQRWTPDDGQRGDSKTQNVEGRATGH
jgi:hypothetical protein